MARTNDPSRLATRIVAHLCGGLVYVTADTYPKNPGRDLSCYTFELVLSDNDFCGPGIISGGNFSSFSNTIASSLERFRQELMAIC